MVTPQTQLCAALHMIGPYALAAIGNNPDTLGTFPPHCCTYTVTMYSLTILASLNGDGEK